MQIKRRLVRYRAGDGIYYANVDRDLFAVLPLLWVDGMPVIGPAGGGISFVQEWESMENEVRIPKQVYNPFDGIITSKNVIVCGRVYAPNGQDWPVYILQSDGSVHAAYRGQLPSLGPVTWAGQAVDQVRVRACYALIPAEAGPEFMVDATLVGCDVVNEGDPAELPAFVEPTSYQAWEQIVLKDGVATLAQFDGRRAAPSTFELSCPNGPIDWDLADVIALSGAAEMVGWD